MRRSHRVLGPALILALALGTGCGDDDGQPGTDGSAGNNNTSQADGGGGVDPVLIPGGGVTSGAINGTLNVYVVGARDDAPLSGATVRVGEPEAPTPLVATTNAQGLAVFQDASLQGAQTVTAHASGHAAATWFGVAGANVTIPLAVTPPPAVDTALVSGTITGWGSMPDPPIGHYRFALINYSHTHDLLDKANGIEQPQSGDFPANTCFFMAFVAENDCNWSLITRTGPQVLYAVILHGDPNGTNNDPSDDILEVVGYALRTGLNPTSGETLTNQDLTQLPSNQLVSTTVTFQAAPSGLGTVLGVPYLDLGDPEEGHPGRLAVYAFNTNTNTAAIPSLTGEFAGGSYDLIAMAYPSDDVRDPFTASFSYDITPGGTISTPAWLPPPTNVAAASGTYSYTQVSGANLHAVSFADASENPVWGVNLLDGRTSFTLPTLSPDPLPSGSVKMTVTALVLPGFDPTDFASRDFVDVIAQTSLASTTFTR